MHTDASVPINHFAHHERLMAKRVDRVNYGSRDFARNNDCHANAEVEDVFHFVVGDVPGALDFIEDPRLWPLPAVDDRVAIVRKNPIDIAWQTTARDVREGVHR